jgi:hypothetical protein
VLLVGAALVGLGFVGVVDGVALLELEAGAVAAGVWLGLLFGSGVVLDVDCPTAKPAVNSNAADVYKTFFMGYSSWVWNSPAQLVAEHLWCSLARRTHVGLFHLCS